MYFGPYPELLKFLKLCIKKYIWDKILVGLFDRIFNILLLFSHLRKFITKDNLT